MENMELKGKIGVVTVLYNSVSVLEDFFATLDKQTYTDFILYVIDNNSVDDSLKVARKLAGEVSFKCVFIANDENYGVAKGNNIGIRAALKDGCDLVLLSNNDIVLVPDTIGSLLAGMLENQAVMAVPKIYFHGTNLIWAAGGSFVYLKGYTRHTGLKEEDRGQYDVTRQISYAPTCFMLIDAAVFKRVGEMDEKYFVYYDDTDFVWRAVKQGKERMVYIPASRLWHKESVSVGGQMSDFAITYMNRNAVYFARKNFSFPQRQIVGFYRLIHRLLVEPFVLSSHQLKIAREARRKGKEMIIEK